MNPKPTLRGATVAAEWLRDAGVEDAASIESVHSQSREAAYRSHVAQWPPSGPDRDQRVARWESWLADPGIHCVVAQQGQEILGFVTVRGSTDDDLPSTRIAEMPTLYIAPDHWRRGLGSILCDVAVERARSLGFDALVLWVLEINEPARAFYASVGFEPDGATRIDDGTPEAFEAHRYRLQLSETTE